MRLFSHYTKDQTSSNNQVVNWQDFSINDFSLYSCRETFYDTASYPSNLHYHDYYELVVFEKGNIDYICENSIFTPSFGDVIIIPPGKLHMSKINADKTVYKRHVFYFYPQLFDAINGGDLISFLTALESGRLYKFSTFTERENFISLLNELGKIAVDPTQNHKVLALSYLIRIFYTLSSNNHMSNGEQVNLPKKLLSVKNFIDKNFDKINTVSDISNEYFYSREYLSRLFKKYFNSTLMDYVNKKRIIKSQELLKENKSITEIAYSVGFGSLSTFIRCFKQIAFITPSEYKKLLNNDK